MKKGTPPPSIEAPVFYTPTKLEHTPMKEGTPPPSTEDPSFSRLLNWNLPQWKKASIPPPSIEGPVFYTPSKLEHTSIKQGTPSSSTEAHFFHAY